MTNDTVWSNEGRIVPMTCDACGATMNPHAEKPVVAATRAEAERMDPAFGGLIEEIHQCPACGSVQSRRE